MTAKAQENTQDPQSFEDITPRIAVFGVGGAGGNAVNNMIRSDLKGVEFYVCNTDAQALKQSMAPYKMQLGPAMTKGLGAGSKPEVGKGAAEEVIEDVATHFDGVNMVFVTAGMGGGTGTGAAPVIAKAAREKGLLTVGVVTKPFHFEGVQRMHAAEQGIAEMQKHVDTLIVIPNQNLFRVATERTTFSDAFLMADDVLHAGVRGVTDLMIMPGLINLDFADVRTVMSEMGKAMMGTGEAEGDNRAIEAAEAAISNPLLDDVSMRGARGVLISITGGDDLTLYEVDEAANRIREEVDSDANIIFGSTFNQELNGKIRVSVVATGIDANDMPHSQHPASQVPKNYMIEEEDESALSLDEDHAYDQDDLYTEDDADNLEHAENDDLFSADNDQEPSLFSQDNDAESRSIGQQLKDDLKDFEDANRDLHEKFGTDDQNHKPSFLERLGFGRKKAAAAYPSKAANKSSKQPSSRRKMPLQNQDNKDTSVQHESMDQNEDNYDIPAYLRRK